MKLEHKHLLVRAEVNNCPTKEDLGYVLSWMNNLINTIDMKLMQGPNISYIDQIGNRGITCMALIETSHIALHIWDEVNPALVQLDVYSCSDFEPKKVLDILQELKPTKVEHKYLDREKGFKEL